MVALGDRIEMFGKKGIVFDGAALVQHLDTIAAYVEAYNAGDIDGVMALFSEESVVSNSPLDPQVDGQSQGLAEIRSLHRADMTSAAGENAYTISNVQVSGNTVSWDHVWVNNVGTEWCAQGHSAVVEDGIILSWTFAGATQRCPFDPASALAAYGEARNAGDVDVAVAFYAEDAVVTGHPLDEDGVATGIDEIRALEEQIPAAQGSGDGIEFVDVEVSGSTVTFNSRFFYGANGSHAIMGAGCSGRIGDTATFEDGKIVLYEWGPAAMATETPCSA